MQTVNIGTSGWHYAHWRGPFYPETLAPAEMLRCYAEHFDTVEINNSFYRLPTDDALAKWHAETPADFTYVRLHGPGEKAYQGNYTKPRLRDWAKKIEAWQSDLKSIYFYFDNDQAGYAAKNAGELKRLVFG